MFACGRAPYFPAWADVPQLNAFQPGLRQAVIGTLLDIAGQCDGLRCDMAMLLINSIFERTWGNRAGISAIKKAQPNLLFMAEAYWNLEWELQQHKGSITVTTSACTTAWNTTVRKACGSIFALTLPTREDWCGSSKITMSPGRLQHFLSKRSVPPPSQRA